MSHQEPGQKRARRIAYFKGDKSDQTPRYKKINDKLLLIGVRHEDAGKNESAQGKIAELKRQLDSLDHLCLEGMRETHKDAALPENTWERIALRHFRGQLHFLEDDCPHYLKLLEKHGLSIPSFTALTTLPFAQDIVRGDPSLKYEKESMLAMTIFMEGMCKADPRLAASIFEDTPLEGFEDFRRTVESMKMGSLDDFKEAVKSEVERFQKVSPAYKLLVLEDVVVLNPKFPLSYLFFSELSYVLCRQAIEELTLYLGWLNDHEVYAPRIREMQTTVPGKIGVIFGVGHVEYMSELLSGKSDASLPTWQEFVAELDEKVRTFIQSVESVIGTEVVTSVR